MILRANTVLKYKNPTGFGLEPEIINQLNSLGFRGEEIPEDFEKYTSIIAIGGSTTACRAINEGQDWIHVFKHLFQENTDEKIWVNNAGLDGNSTYAHLILLKSHISKIAPDYIFYLIGINEVERKDLNLADLRWQTKSSYSLKDWLKKHSEVALMIETIKRRFFGYKFDANGEMQAIKNPTFTEIDTQKIKTHLASQKPYLKAFENRLRTLINETKAIGTKPVLITQPFLLGEGKDPKTGIDLETIETWIFDNGHARWLVLESYNDVTRRLAEEYNIPCIDLAQEMPKSTEYFYDSMHFTKAGAQKVGEIIWENWKFLNK